MSNKLYDETSVKAIADAIRAKNGTSTTYKVADMAGAISLLDGGSSDGVLTPSTFPNYIMENVNTIVSRAKSYIKSDSIVFLSMSDFHNSGSEATSDQAQINKSNLHAAMAAKAFAYTLKMDFMCNLGDMSWGSDVTTEDQQKEQIEIIEGYLAEAFSDVPQFWTPGNHDCGKYSEVFSGGLGASYLFSHIGAHSNGATYGSTTSGYCYRDFADKSLRVICLNTCDENEKEALTDAQKLWFCNTLNSTPAGYSIIILSHHPLDWGGVCQASNIVYQYQLRGSWAVSGTTVSFANAKANVICAFHGHVHGYKYDKLNNIANSTGTPYNVYRMATPNCCFIRNNEYGRNDKTEYWDIEFGETTTYNKTADTVNDTAMTLNVINPTDKMIYSFTYGAGPSIRSFSYDMTVEAPTIYTITTNTSNGVVISVPAAAEEGTSISSTYSISDGYELKSVVVTMGGTDITSTAVSGTSINIAEVTGDIIITVIAAVKSKYNVTNLVLTSEEQTSTAVYNNGLGYKDGYKASEGSSGAESTASGYTVTGFIPYTWNPSNVIYIRGAELSNDSSTRIYGYTDKATGAVQPNAYALGSRIYADDNIYFDLETLEEGTYYKLTPVSNNLTNITHIRISLKGTGENLIVTVNEPIEEAPEKIAVTGVTLNTSQIDSMTVGDTYQLTATVAPSNATNKDMTWSISNTTYATVSSAGLITAKAVSSASPAAIITATTIDGNYTASCALSKVVGVAVTGVTLNTSQIELEVGKTYQLTATVAPSNATNKAVTWSSSNNEYVTVSSTGLVTAKAVADASPAAYITVTTSDGGFTVQVPVVVKESTPVNYTNLVPTSLEPGSDELMNGGLGYRDGYYASAASPGYGVDVDTTCSGAVLFNKTLYPTGSSVDFYVKGIDFDGTSHCRLAGRLDNSDGTYSWTSNSYVKEGYTSAWTDCVTCEKLGDKYFKFAFTPVYANGKLDSRISRLWFSAKGTGENLIITKNEPIE